MIGKSISHYKIMERLGAGGMGVVYKAHDTVLNRPVALKSIPDEDISPEKLSRFIIEAQSAASINHPNVCTVYSVEGWEGKKYIAMEYIDGVTLREKMSSTSARGNVQGGLSVNEALSYVVQIAEGLAEAHKQGIIHRDIKPENIMITKDNRVKIMDFGLAKLKGKPGITKDETTVGTVQYMSPEQIQGREIDQRTDIWSLGVLLYELLTGRSPFKGEYESEIVYKIVNETAPPVSQFLPDASPDLISIIDRMLEKEPDTRNDTITGVLTEFKKLQGKSHQPSMKKEPENSVAVIDFMNLTGNTDDDWLSGGIAETVTVDLKKVSSLKVVSRESILKLLSSYGKQKFSEQQIIDLGHRLHVRWIIWGAFQKLSGSIRITPHFTDIRSGELIGSAKIDGKMEEIFELQDRIIHHLKDFFNLKIASSEIKKMKAPHTDKTLAYEYYAKGRQEFQLFNPESLKKARDYFKKALEIDPEYALAYSGLGTTYIFHFIAHADQDSLDTGIENLKKAIKIDASLAEPHHWLSYAYLRKEQYHEGVYHGKQAVEIEGENFFTHYFKALNYLALASLKYEFQYFNDATRHLKLCIKHEPNYQWGYHFLSWIYLLFGKYDRVRSCTDKAIELDRTKRYENLRCIGVYPVEGFLNYHTGRYDDAIVSFQNSLEGLRDSKHVYKDAMVTLSNYGLGCVHSIREQYGDSLEYFNKAIAQIEQNPKALGIGSYMVLVRIGIAKLFQKMGLKRETEENLRKALDIFHSKEGYNFSLIWLGSDAEILYEMATYYAITRDEEKTIATVVKAVDCGWRNVQLLKTDEAFRHIRSNKEFRKLIDKVESMEVPLETQ